MVRHFVKLLNLLDVGPNNRFLFFKHSDRSVDLHVHKVLVIEILESNRHLILSLLVEDDLKRARVIVDFKESAHGLLLLGSDAANDDDLVDRVAIDLTDVVRARRCLLDHLERDGGKDAILAPLTIKVATCAILHVASTVVEETRIKVVASHVLAWVEESLV